MLESASRGSAWGAPFAVLASLALVSGEQHPSIQYAVNCGGSELLDASTGVLYAADTDDVSGASPTGVAADTPIPITLAPESVQRVFQTERYALSTFSYSVTTPANGDYTLVLRVSEVYWRQPGGKVFDVFLGDQQIRIVRDLDIFAAAGWGTAHDIYTAFSIVDGKLVVDGEVAEVDDTFSIDFVKATADNPKINAIVIVEGSPEDAAKLTPLVAVEEPQPVEDDVDDDTDYDDDAPMPEEDIEDIQGEPVKAEAEGGFPIIPLVFAALAIVGINEILKSL